MPAKTSNRCGHILGSIVPKLRHYTMNVSMSSALKNHPQFTHFPPSNSLRRHHNNSKIVSCRANMSTDHSTLSFQRMLPCDCKNASVHEIKKAYRKLALRYHPDVCDPSRKKECTKMFVELQETYRGLLVHASRESSRVVGSKEKQCRGWESQLVELSRRSHYRRAQNEGSWGCRMRSQFIYA